MRIAHCFPALIAVLGLAAVVLQVSCYEHFNDTLHGSRFRPNSRKRHFHEGRYEAYYDHSIPLSSPGMYRGPRDNQALLRFETHNHTRDVVDCCPTVLEMVEPYAGKNQDGILVDLYRDENYKQRFYELSCHKDILNKPCRFMDRKLHNQSRCVQQHSYTYALVKDKPSNRNRNFPTFPAHGSDDATYTLDYISVRSGCSCVVTPNKKKRNKVKHKRKNDDER
ncbi:uncharacterized protein LOC108911392 [Anoplophora glabripennis]|uniref:uncharacterized protein LOC108911392 n=1 Tax=Anoplophora glabripennis TaxID=217634 RepID=UPI00087378B3|nr:uncharacterized protein LOC108911392 [Anoplophora glabripennis]